MTHRILGNRYIPFDKKQKHFQSLVADSGYTWGTRLADDGLESWVTPNGRDCEVKNINIKDAYLDIYKFIEENRALIPEKEKDVTNHKWHEWYLYNRTDFLKLVNKYGPLSINNPKDIVAGERAYIWLGLFNFIKDNLNKKNNKDIILKDDCRLLMSQLNLNINPKNEKFFVEHSTLGSALLLFCFNYDFPIPSNCKQCNKSLIDTTKKGIKVFCSDRCKIRSHLRLYQSII